MSAVPPPPPPPPPPGGSLPTPPAPSPKVSQSAPAFTPPPPAALVPPAGNVTIPRATMAPSAPHVAPILSSDSSDRVSTAEAGIDVLALLASLTAFVLLYLDLFQKTKG